MTYGQPKRLPEEVREALGRMFDRNPDDFRPPEERKRLNQINLNPGLQERANAVAERFVGPQADQASRQLRVDIASAVYTLLEAQEGKGITISDNEHTLRVIDLLIRRIKARGQP